MTQVAADQLTSADISAMTAIVTAYQRDGEHAASLAVTVFREQAVQEAVAERDARIAELEAAIAFMTAYPRGTRVRKASGPQWNGVVVGHYSSSFTPQGLVIECTVEGAREQVHVEPAKRMEIDNDG